MASAVQYWIGAEKVEFAATDVEAPTIKADSKFDPYILGVMNNAFRIFYDARQLISRVSDYTVKRAMTADLDEVARTGWGMGVNDLKEACEHLADNGGKWKDDNTSSWGWHTSGQIGGLSRHAQIGYVKVPISLENFLDALNAKAVTLNAQLTALRQHGSAVVTKVATSVGDQALPTVGTPEWTAFGNGLKQVNKAQDGIKAMLWLAAVSEHSTMNTTSVKLGKVLDAIGKVRGACESFDSASRAGYGTVESMAFAAIAEGLGCIPVLGAYYQAAFGLIPGITAGMIAIVQRRNALAAKLGVDLRTSLEY